MSEIIRIIPERGIQTEVVQDIIVPPSITSSNIVLPSRQSPYSTPIFSNSEPISLSNNVIDGIFPKRGVQLHSFRGTPFLVESGQPGFDKDGIFVSQHDNGAVVHPGQMHGSILEEFTAVMVFKITSSASLIGNRRMVGNNYHNYGVYSGHSFFTVGTSLSFKFSDTTNVATYNTNSTIELNKLCVAVATMKRNGTGWTSNLFQSGVPHTTVTGPYTRQTSLGQFELFGRNDDISQPIGSAFRLYGFYYINAPLSISEAYEVLNNPYKPLRGKNTSVIDLGANSINAKKPATVSQSFMLGTVQPGPKPSIAPLVLKNWKRYSQPTSTYSVNWGNECAEGLSSALSFVGNTYYNLAVDKPARTDTIYGTRILPRPTPWGLGQTHPTSGEGYAAERRITSIPTRPSLIILTEFVLNTSVNITNGIICAQTGGSQAIVTGNTGFAIYVTIASGVATLYFKQNYSNSVITVPNVTPGKHTVAVGMSLSQGFVFYLDGKEAGAAPAIPVGSYLVTSEISTASFENPSITGAGAGWPILKALINTSRMAEGQFNTAMLASLSENPWQLFKPTSQRIFVGV